MSGRLSVHFSYIHRAPTRDRDSFGSINVSRARRDPSRGSGFNSRAALENAGRPWFTSVHNLISPVLLRIRSNSRGIPCVGPSRSAALVSLFRNETDPRSLSGERGREREREGGGRRGREEKGNDDVENRSSGRFVAGVTFSFQSSNFALAYSGWVPDSSRRHYAHCCTW